MQLFLLERHDAHEAMLSKEESRHCIKVLRHKKGDEIYVTDGVGMAWRGIIADDHWDATLVHLQEPFPEFGEHGKTIRLLFSPLRLRDRQEWMMEKSVELGVTELIPIRTARTDKYQALIKPDRIRTILAGATKQCLRSRIPSLMPEQTIEEYVSGLSARSGLRMIARSDATNSLKTFQDELQSEQDLSLMIGPEGDFTDTEIKEMQAIGFRLVNLGEQRLRSETAGVYGLSAIKLMLGF